MTMDNAQLSDHLKTEHRKLSVKDHGGKLTTRYLNYAAQDVQVTWECFDKLQKQYESYGLTKTVVNKIYSEASHGKANLLQMGIKPWHELQPDFPPELIGAMMCSYYGGRSEVRIRRQIARVLYCDFLSMYPTVCTLMGLWRFVIAKKTIYTDVTAETQKLLEEIQLEDWQKPEMWRLLTTLVCIQPSEDILPIRAKYDDDQYSIGVNFATSPQATWYTLADCIASKLLSGHAPKVAKAIQFRPKGMQSGLSPIDIIGKSDYHVNPRTDDFYRRLIDLRTETKAKSKAAQPEEKERLDAEQLALKICANATSYGIFVELNEGSQKKPQQVNCYGVSEDPFVAEVNVIEEEGKYFHPLLATLITGAARLMLAIAECLAEREGISWAICDTDSMALAKPEEVSEEEFIRKARNVQGWFTKLNPYQKKEPLFNIEDENYKLKDGRATEEIEPLYCFAVSAKRYALFNLDNRKRPVIRKASAHGLGHLLAPYDEKASPRNIPKPTLPLSEIGVDRWQYDLWFLIVKAAIDGDSAKVDLDKLPGLNKPAASRYGATTPTLLNWFKIHNAGKSYRDQVKPFNFLLSFHAGIEFRDARPIAAYDRDIKRASKKCFDRNTSLPLSSGGLKTYREILAQYHLHPEAKFENGDFLESGFTRRRHIFIDRIEHIGKEARSHLINSRAKLKLWHDEKN